jgi:hypothetical protein
MRRLVIASLVLCPLLSTTGQAADSLPPMLLSGFGRAAGKAIAILETNGGPRFVRQGDELTLTAGAGIVRMRVAEIGKDFVRIDLAEGSQSLTLRMGAQVKADVSAARAPGKDQPEGSRKLEAWVAAQDFVRERMRSPSTAAFGNQNPETCVKSLGSDRFLVQGWVDAQNPTGAIVRADFTLTMQKKADSWALTSGPVLNQR